jgi:hypothetical protein
MQAYPLWAVDWFLSNIYNNIKKVQVVYMGFLNYNKIFEIDILNLETGCNKIRDDFDYVV